MNLIRRSVVRESPETPTDRALHVFVSPDKWRKPAASGRTGGIQMLTAECCIAVQSARLARVMPMIASALVQRREMAGGTPRQDRATGRFGTLPCRPALATGMPCPDMGKLSPMAHRRRDAIPRHGRGQPCRPMGGTGHDRRARPMRRWHHPIHRTGPLRIRVTHLNRMDLGETYVE